MSQTRSRTLFKEIAAVIVLFCIISVPFTSKLGSHPFHVDESYWIYNSGYFKLFFLDQNIQSKAWEYYLAYDNPPIGKYLIGLGLFITGNEDKINIIGWNFSRDHQWNVAHGAMPPEKTLYFARLTMAIFGIFTCMLVYWIGRKMSGIVEGVIAALLLAYNPLMLLCGRRAMVDAPLLFFFDSKCDFNDLFSPKSY